MVGYRRNFIPGGTFFFTVTVVDRSSSLLVEQIVSLRHAFRLACAERPFKIDAIVILPDHLHTIMKLPEGDSDFSGRWRRIKSVFSRQVVAEECRPSETAAENTSYGRGDSGSTRFVTKRILRGTSITSTTIQSSMVWYRV